MNGLLEGKKIIVTGARGLAKGMIAGLSGAGGTVAAISRSDSASQLVKEGIAAYAVKADLRSRTARQNAFSRALEALGGEVDVLVNCAGIQRRNELEDFTFEDWDDVIDVNLTATWELSQLAARRMIAQGRGGKIINIASMISFFGGFRIPAYAASKGGVMQLTKSMAIGWAKYGIQVNALAPGYMATDMNTALMDDPKRSADILRRIPAGRWGTPEDMAGPCVFLASNQSDYITGAIIPVDGGYLVT